ncbi:conserved hypothetical protein [Ricinus communis]|uniref:Uncharacterized protein n=1 Tax=Ricinus communis TaxID=3988 RepID=B9RVD4_RICCO|nr:conserved hypothetical protein [Ricinus communis]
MNCSLCKAKGHNKKGCPNKGTSTSQASVNVMNTTTNEVRNKNVLSQAEAGNRVLTQQHQ